MRVLLSILLLTGLWGCDNQTIQQEKQKVIEDRIDNVELVLIHKVGNYSLMVLKDASPELTPRLIFGSTRIFMDVPPDQKMWAVQRFYYSPDSASAEIHIHSPKDIAGGEWSDGKFGNGNTQIVR